MFCKTRCFGKFRKLQRKTPLSTSLFNKVAGLQTWNIVKKSLQHSYFPAKSTKILRTPTQKNIRERLLRKGFTGKF